MHARRDLALGAILVLLAGSCGQEPAEPDGGGDLDGDLEGEPDADGEADRDGGGDGGGDGGWDGGPDRDGEPDGEGEGEPDAELEPGPECDPTVRDGIVTYYAADGSGNCSFPRSPSDLMVAAMNHPDYEGSYACGACVEVEGPLGRVTVRVVDRCPECASGHVDLSVQAFEAVARRADGRVGVEWSYVPCESEEPIRYHFKDGSNQWWSAVQVRNHRHRVARFEAWQDGAWREVPRLEYNFFVASSPGLGPGPYDFRVTDEYGQVLVDRGIAFVEGGEVAGAAQFPSCR